MDNSDWQEVCKLPSHVVWFFLFTSIHLLAGTIIAPRWFNSFPSAPHVVNGNRNPSSVKHQNPFVYNLSLLFTIRAITGDRTKEENKSEFNSTAVNQQWCYSDQKCGSSEAKKKIKSQEFYESKVTDERQSTRRMSLTSVHVLTTRKWWILIPVTHKACQQRLGYSNCLNISQCHSRASSFHSGI